MFGRLLKLDMLPTTGAPPRKLRPIFVGLLLLALVATLVAVYNLRKEYPAPGVASRPVPVKEVKTAPVAQPKSVTVPVPRPVPVPSPVSEPPQIIAAQTFGEPARDHPAQSDMVPKELLDAVAEASKLVEADSFVKARELYLGLLPRTQGEMHTRVEAEIGRLSVALVLNPYAMPEKVDYTVAPGDSVAKIAQKFGTTAELIEKSNRIANPNIIKAGDRLRVLTGKFEIQANKTTRDMVVTLNGRFFKRYGIGTGKFGKTPVGTFEIDDKIPEPVWWKPDGVAVPFGEKENILGTRWMSIRATGSTDNVKGYGIHGTWDPDSIGKAESGGCIRMRNAEVEELFAILPIGTSVTITE